MDLEARIRKLTNRVIRIDRILDIMLKDERIYKAVGFNDANELRVLREEISSDLWSDDEEEVEVKDISCATCKYADYSYQLEPCKTCINNYIRDDVYTKWEEA